MISLNVELDRSAIRAALEANTFTQVSSFLDPKCAKLLAAELAAEAEWDLAITGPNGPMAVSARELQTLPRGRQASLVEGLRRQARSGFSFHYLRRDVVPADQPFCVDWATWLAQDQTVHLWRQLTGDETLVRADAHACLYRPGHFLRTHDDTYSGKKRRFAYVMNLSRDWQADWGGLLHFVDRPGVKGTLTPSFNSLCLFRVPQDHCVSQVASYARFGRYSITGWLFA